MLRASSINIPTDLLRTAACIADLGSYGKAGEKLGLSQPAISAQIKRLQFLVGGPIFAKTAGGVALNEKGKLLMPLVRRLLETNDRILEFSGVSHGPRLIRVGLTELYADAFFEAAPKSELRDILVVSDSSSELLRGLQDAYIDVCAIMRPSEEFGRVLYAWSEQFVWVRSLDFVVSPGAPVPIIGAPGLMTVQIAAGLFEEKGIAYRLAFHSVDRIARLAAARAGVGLMLLPSWSVPDYLVRAKEYYLPLVPSIEAGIMARKDLEIDGMPPIVSTLSRIFPVKSRDDVAEPRRKVIGS